MNFDYKNIYITGGGGWLGKVLIQTLLNGDPDVLDSFKPFKGRISSFLLENEPNIFENKKVEPFFGDIRSINNCNAFLKDNNNGLLIHCAGIIHPKKVKDFDTINYQGTKNIINSAISSGIKKIVVVSSNSPIGCNKSNKSLFDENSPYNPYMGYGKSKKNMEVFLKDHIKAGVDISIIRPPWFYGENMPERQLTFYKMIKNGVFPMIGSGKNIRSKANVKNIVQGILLCAGKSVSKGETY